jgi:hypothetical protein
MVKMDDHYRMFMAAYRSNDFLLAGRLVYQIISELQGLRDLPKDEWHYKFSELIKFLSRTGFVFDSPDTFYDTLAIIAIQLKKNPGRDWKDILNG